MNATQNLRINEIFFSLQGETRTVGLPTVFVRLTGCPLRCVYCDTEYAFHKGDMMSLEAIVSQVEGYGTHYVTVSGGEPLAQPNCLPLLSQLCDKGFEVSLETSGALDIANVDPRVITVMDLKTPSSGECSKNLESNIGHLKPHDQVKFVISDRKDYEWSKAKSDQFDLKSRVCEVLFSPVFATLSYKDLAQWILDDRLNVRMQLQLHKHIWGDTPGH